MNKFLTAAQQFAAEEDGAQVIEYALIIAVVSIILVAALSDLDGTGFTAFITKVQTCLSTGVCTAPAAA